MNYDPEELPSWMTTLFAIAAGLLAANVYYSQPIAELTATSLGFSSSATGLIVAFMQAGFGIGLFLIVPLGDLMENRRLILTLTGVTGLALLTTAISSSPTAYLASALLVGLGSVAVQVLIPFAAHMAPERIRGRVVGNVMSGLMIGIMLARPASSFATQAVSWHALFYISGAGMLALALALALALPKREPAATISYLALLRSMGRLALTTPVLQQRALYQACLFGAFSLFWTTVPLLLTGSFHISQESGAIRAGRRRRCDRGTARGARRGQRVDRAGHGLRHSLCYGRWSYHPLRRCRILPRNLVSGRGSDPAGFRDDGQPDTRSTRDPCVGGRIS
jgi:predicted MFS family arabinose efflux permease